MKLALIDFLKGYSIFTIVIFHLLQFCQLSAILNKLITFGGAGIHVFILCSGLGLGLSQRNKPLKYLDFLKKRFFKIYIPYIIVILISSFFTLMYEYDDKWMALFSHIFLYKMFNEKWMTSYGYQFWFISMILQFYLFFPILFSLVQRYKWRIFFFSLIISISWSTIVWHIGKEEIRIWNSFFLQYLWEFILGILLAFIISKNNFLLKIPRIKYLIPLTLISLILMFFSGIKGGVYKLFNDPFVLIAYLGIALLIFSIGKKLTWIQKFFLKINQVSYEWYLLHMIVFILIFNSIQPYCHMALTAVISLTTSYILAISYNTLLKKYIFKK